MICGLTVLCSVYLSISEVEKYIHVGIKTIHVYILQLLVTKNSFGKVYSYKLAGARFPALDAQLILLHDGIPITLLA